MNKNEKEIMLADLDKKCKKLKKEIDAIYKVAGIEE